MPHPTEDILPNGTCRVCGDGLTRPVHRRGQRVYRRHKNNSDCPTKGRGEPVTPVRRT